MNEKTKDLVMGLLDEQIEVVNKNPNGVTLGKVYYAVDKLVESRTYLQCEGELDQVAFEVVEEWLDSSVRSMHPDNVDEIMVAGWCVGLAEVGGAWMAVEHYKVAKKVEVEEWECVDEWLDKLGFKSSSDIRTKIQTICMDRNMKGLDVKILRKHRPMLDHWKDIWNTWENKYIALSDVECAISLLRGELGW